MVVFPVPLSPKASTPPMLGSTRFNSSASLRSSCPTVAEYGKIILLMIVVLLKLLLRRQNYIKNTSYAVARPVIEVYAMCKAFLMEGRCEVQCFDNQSLMSTYLRPNPYQKRSCQVFAPTLSYQCPALVLQIFDQAAVEKTMSHQYCFLLFSSMVY